MHPCIMSVFTFLNVFVYHFAIEINFLLYIVKNLLSQKEDSFYIQNRQ